MVGLRSPFATESRSLHRQGLKKKNAGAVLKNIIEGIGFGFLGWAVIATLVITVLNIQPVYPIHLTPDWNLITRPILPHSAAYCGQVGLSSPMTLVTHSIG